jgi:hypothetical protein
MTRDEEVLDIFRRKPTWWETKILPRILPADETDCHQWGGYVSPDNGYGYVKLPGLRTAGGSAVNGRVHRIVYLHEHGEIPSETLDHLCRHRACVNVTHLEAVTAQENLLRGETIVAVNAAKMSCPKGHPLSGDNLITYNLRLGQRSCAECSRERSRRWKTTRKEMTR